MAQKSQRFVKAPRNDSANELANVLVETYSVNDAMNQHLLANLNPHAWRGERLGPRGSGRTIAAIFAHLHNCRLVWLKNSAPHLKCPAALDPYRCTMGQAAAAHRKSAAQCARMLADVLTGGEKRKVTKFSRGSWAPVWPAGGAMFAYMFSHEAHHRGQILMLAHQLGYRIPPNVWGRIWQWDRLWKEAGFNTRPR
jgi:uncharacterized damage-inducible protein DinB